MIGLSGEGANIFKIDFVLYDFQDNDLLQFGKILDIIMLKKCIPLLTLMALEELIIAIIVMSLLSLPWTRKLLLFRTRMKYWQCYELLLVIVD